MTAVMIGEENKRVFRLANAALADRVWAKLLKAGAVTEKTEAKTSISLPAPNISTP